MKRIACQTCHIPYLTASADLVYDHASSGKTILYDTSKFLSNHPLDTKVRSRAETPVSGIRPSAKSGGVSFR